METKQIKIINAKENNLKNISVDIPKNKLTVITGLSGSGKSTLAFDVLYNEGRRRYMNSLSSYARQFLGGVTKPDVEQIIGLSPAIAIDQKSTSNNPRSTVGTITEISDYLRLLYAKIGVPYCPNHNIPITAQSTKTIVDKIFTYKEGTKLQILAPMYRETKGEFNELFIKLRREGFLRVKVDDKLYSLDEKISLEKNKRHNISIIVDRIILHANERSRIFDAIETGSTYAKGLIIINFNDKEEELFSKNYACKLCDFAIPSIEPRLFSFNAPYGSCKSCHGLGYHLSADWDILTPNKNYSIAAGGLEYFKHTVGTQNYEWNIFSDLMKAYNINIEKQIKDLTEDEINIIMNGSDKPIETKFRTKTGNTYERVDYIEGIGKLIERRYVDTQSESQRDYYRQFMSETTCSTCNGARLNSYALSVRINNLNIHQFGDLSIEKDFYFVANYKLTEMEKQISEMIVKEISQRLKFLIDVGLDYLTLNRMAGTLSGGESQRIRLATQIGSKLTGIIYVLDEPSIGLHQKDNKRLIETLKQIRDLENSVIVVEHDEETILEADYVIDIGPKAGDEGGEIVFAGEPKQLLTTDTLTGEYLSFRREIPVPSKRREGINRTLRIEGATENNLKNINVDFPLGKLIAVTGVSGSGKSTLVDSVLTSNIEKYLHGKATNKIGACKKIIGLEYIDKIVRISQDPIGRTPRSNPVTYTGIFDEIRNLFSATEDANIKGLTKSHFSFNVPVGRCEKCQGDGLIRISMNFLPDVYVKCDDCNGKRYNEEVLSIKYRNKSIYDVLEMQISEAADFFKNIPKIIRKLEYLIDVGLDYLKLGYSATILSGGEAQRIKLATHLQKRATGRTIYVLDEPTVGLHMYDVHRLVNVLEKMVEKGDTLIIIEHNLDLIKVVDHIIDLGPNGGSKGGQIIAIGTPEQIMLREDSYTGQYLKIHLNRKQQFKIKNQINQKANYFKA